MKSTWMKLSQEERLTIQRLRARRMTGYDTHVAYHPADSLDERVPFGYYIWRMGEQPKQEWINRMAGSDPVQAARKFLDHYKARNELPRQYPAGTYTNPEER